MILVDCSLIRDECSACGRPAQERRKLYTSARKKRTKCRRFAMGIVAILCVVVNRTSPYSIQDHERVSPSFAVLRAKLVLLSFNYIRVGQVATTCLSCAGATSCRNDRYEWFPRPSHCEVCRPLPFARQSLCFRRRSV
uniref:Uncharacterized protein n=1 Tax=Peronospora matthiolae TaxID=2874970 RepID=A0AAV1V196_9STRA